jgi:hypothetical protein
MFSISFSDEPLEYPFDDPSIPAAPGKLMLGKSEEEFLANLSLWSKPDYQSHWRRELKALVDGSSKIALVVSYDDPKASYNMEIWRVYRSGEWAHFQNQLLFYSSLPDGFDVSEISCYIQDRATTTANGDRISEWNVALRDIELFLRRSGEF